ncbi:hypothetical protein HPB47_009258, partial [Ixodes persulcatus]
MACHALVVLDAVLDVLVDLTVEGCGVLGATGKYMTGEEAAGVCDDWLLIVGFVDCSPVLTIPNCRLYAGAGAWWSPTFDLLSVVIRNLSSNGIFVKAVVCDQGAINCTLARRLGVTPDNPFFIVGDTQVYVLFDTPHMLKCTRNNLRKHDLQIASELIR